MKKITTLLTCIMMLACASSTFAAMKVGGNGYDPKKPNNGDYIGVIKAAVYRNKDFSGKDGQSIYIITTADQSSKSNYSNINISIDGNDLPFGQTLANSIGQKIRLSGKKFEIYDDISSILISADGFDYGARNY